MASTVKSTERVRKFLVRENGDPFTRHAWDVVEVDGPHLWFRGDLSGTTRGLGRTVAMLRRLYPGCRIRVER